MQSVCSETGVTVTAAELALQVKRNQWRVLAADMCTDRQLQRDLGMEGFSWLEDVRQLVRPLHEARWRLEAVPRFAFLCYPFEWPRFSAGQYALIKRDDTALSCLKASIAELSEYYDTMVVDVSFKDRDVMAMVTEVSDEIHLMLRAEGEGSSIDHWLDYVGLEGTDDLRARIITHDDRGRSPVAESSLKRSKSIQVRKRKSLFG